MLNICGGMTPWAPLATPMVNNILLQGRQNNPGHFWHTSNISRKLARKWKFGLCCYGQNKNWTGYSAA